MAPTYLARGELSRDELKCLIWALRSANFLSDKRTAALLEKLKGIVGMQLAALTLPEDGAMKCPDDQIIENIDRLSVAIEQRRQVTYSDKDHMDGLARRMRISPYALLWLKKGCCVQPRGAERPKLPRAGEHELHKDGHDPVAQL